MQHCSRALCSMHHVHHYSAPKPTLLGWPEIWHEKSTAFPAGCGPYVGVGADFFEENTTKHISLIEIRPRNEARGHMGFLLCPGRLFKKNGTAQSSTEQAGLVWTFKSRYVGLAQSTTRYAYSHRLLWHTASVTIIIWVIIKIHSTSNVQLHNANANELQSLFNIDYSTIINRD